MDTAEIGPRSARGYRAYLDAMGMTRVSPERGVDILYRLDRDLPRRPGRTEVVLARLRPRQDTPAPGPYSLNAEPV